MDFDSFDGDREQVIERSRAELEFVVNAGRDPESNRKSLELEKSYSGFVIANLGLHPTHTDRFSEVEYVVEQVRKNDPAAIGEIGLDHHHVTDSETRERQEKVFRQMLELAEELGKPVVVHSREAEQKAVEILEEHSVDAMLHCFNRNPDLAERASENFMIGVTTQVLYSGKVREIVERVDLDDLLLETDSPFLYRDGRNEPVNVLKSVEEIAEIKTLDGQQVVKATTGAAKEFFNL